jgi:2,5-diketo-D-gluconate reductase B
MISNMGIAGDRNDWHIMTGILNRTIELLNGASMPVLGLGTWDLRGARCERTVKEAIQLGYRHIDTAEMYGNEAEIGEAIQSVERERLFITSKVSSANFARYDVVRACNQSLSRLGIDYLDLYLLHWPNDAIPLDQTMEGMQRLLADGKIRSIGVSNFDVRRLQEAMDASEAPICNDQVEYHPLRPRDEIPRFCRNHGIALTAYCPLARGTVMGNETLRRIGRQHGKSPAQVSLLWLLKKGAVVIPKASSTEHLVANTELDGWDLTPEDMESIDTMAVRTKLVDVNYT